MTLPRLSLPLLALVSACAGTARPAYPAAPRGDLTVVVGGRTIADPYRGLEAMDAPATRAWLRAENQLTDGILAALPERPALRARIAELAHSERTRPPYHRGARFIWRFNDGVHDQPQVMTATSLDGPAAVALDANDFAEGGHVSYVGAALSQDGATLGFGLARGGGDWQTWHFRDLATGRDLPDTLEGIKYYPPQLVAGGVYYSRFPTPAAGAELTEPDHDCALYFHQLGTPASADRVVYARPDHPSWQFQPALTDDGQTLVIAIGDGEVDDTGLEQLATLALATPGAPVVMLHDVFDARYVFVGSAGATLFFQTNADAPNGKLVAFDPAAARWTDVVPEGTHVIDSAVVAGHHLLVTELRDAHSAIIEHDLRGATERELVLPSLGTAYAMGAGAGDTETTLMFASFATRPTVYRVDLATGALAAWRAPTQGFDPGAFETIQVFVPSADGTKIPMFVTGRRGFQRDGAAHPALLTAYGFGGISSTPWFQSEMIAWLERGGLFAEINVRGGGEYGEAWHQAATREHEQVKLDDFNAGAAWLAAHGSARGRIGAIGTSGGGFLVAAAVLQHPELYGAWFPIAGVLDLLRFQLFGEGAGWQQDLGHPADPVQGAALAAISPVHNVRAGARYPATLVITSDHDVRVAPLHSYKFAAALQAAQAGDAPVLLHVELDSGHGGGAQLSQQIEQSADILAFAAKYLRLPAG